MCYSQYQTSPPHALKNFLLDFSGTIADPLWYYGIEGDEAGAVVKNLSQQMLRLPPGSEMDNATLEKAASGIEFCGKLRTWAKTLELSGSGGGCEPWRVFYRTNFMADLEQAVNKEVNRKLGTYFQGNCYEFLKYATQHFFENGNGLHDGDNADSGAEDAGFCVSFVADDLQAFKQPAALQQLASWRHLLLSNILDIFFDTTAKHLAELGFVGDAVADANTASPGQATKIPSAGLDPVTFPFFVSGCDERSVKCAANNSAQIHPSSDTTVHSSLGVSATCATALEILRRLDGIATGDGEEPLLETQPPAVVAMTFTGKHVGVWAMYRIEHRDLHRAGICIWNGDMTRLRDVVELRVIFERIAIWATTIFRSWVSERVSQWMSLFPQAPAEGEEDDGQLETLGIRIGKLQISRTDSFDFNTPLKPPSEAITAHETANPYTRPNGAIGVRDRQTEGAITGRVLYGGPNEERTN